MTKREPQYLECEQGPEAQLPGPRRRNTDAITAALDYLISRHQNRRWSAPQDPGSDALNTARVLAYLKDALPSFSSSRLRQKINESLDWLAEAHTPGGGWKGRSGEDEAGPTAWAIVALAKNGRTVTGTALEWIRRCRREDGGLGARPGSGDPSSLELTALSIQALGHIDSEAERFLCARLQSDAAGPADQLSACAAILDCDKALMPLALLNQACQVTAHFQAETAWQQALLLRCLLRLRLTRAWSLADALRATQHANGSWSGSDGNDVVATAAVASALVLVDSQPGLYFGSDLPRPRRLRESPRVRT